MPLRNRVTPLGTIEADPARGMLMGNRGCLHDAAGRLRTEGWRTRRWIACVTAFKDRHRALLQPGRWTELFFLDEATALAAGHRPCAECRRSAYRAFLAAWAAAHGKALRADGIDAVLHAERVPPRRGAQRSRRPLAGLPDGAMVLTPDGAPALVLGHRLLPWSHAGYGPPVPAEPGFEAPLLTPSSTVATIAAGYRPILHPSAVALTARGAEERVLSPGTSAPPQAR